MLATFLITGANACMYLVYVCLSFSHKTEACLPTLRVPYQRPKTQEDPRDVSVHINALIAKKTHFIRHCAIRHSETYPHLAHRCTTCPYMNGRLYEVRNQIKLCKGNKIQYIVISL